MRILRVLRQLQRGLQALFEIERADQVRRLQGVDCNTPAPYRAWLAVNLHAAHPWVICQEYEFSRDENRSFKPKRNLGTSSGRSFGRRNEHAAAGHQRPSWHVTA